MKLRNLLKTLKNTPKVTLEAYNAKGEKLNRGEIVEAANNSSNVCVFMVFDKSSKWEKVSNHNKCYYCKRLITACEYVYKENESYSICECCWMDETDQSKWRSNRSHAVSSSNLTCHYCQFLIDSDRYYEYVHDNDYHICSNCFRDDPQVSVWKPKHSVRFDDGADDSESSD